ncbi:UxaA family hydrolase [Lutibacter citreus]|uniref:UxaA family hydrolase n=1 Tax=Lutibacter citreus TaxID=2138210 RepID=UPI000DBE31AB|nr:UxaA family hydrolase [Lutibacter citreus]
MAKSKIIILHPSDNVGVIISDVKKGESIEISGGIIKTISDITFGHKMALKNLSKGEKVKKYGVPIGIITSNVDAGGHVHIHNIESLYMKQYTK